MKLELTLLELNQLYYATSKLVEQNETHLKELGRNVSSIEYFTKELNKSIELRDKIQTALYTEAKELDEAIEYVRNFKAEQYDKERDILKNVIDEEIEPEYDSAGFTEDDRIVNGQYRVISNEDADEDAKQRDYSAFKNYADTLTQDEQRYADSMINAKAEDRKLNNL